MRKFKDYLVLGMKGLSMGAADIVPGVSGGTIAFITNIYQELIDSIKSVNVNSLKLLFAKNGIKQFWENVNGNFLLAVFIGIAISVFTFARIIDYALSEYPIVVWSFFFGLIIASAISIIKGVKKWNFYLVLNLMAGILAAYFVSVLSPATTPDTYFFVFISGAIAICAMILPGISGAFILLLLGKYQFIISALNDLNVPVIVLFILGAGIGLLSFSNLISFFLKKFHFQTIAVLSGFMIGSLNKVWPWKKTLEWTIDRHGESIPLIQKNISPMHYQNLGENNHLMLAIVFFLVGFLLIFLVDFFQKRKPNLKMSV